MPDAVRAGKGGDTIGGIEILRGANLLDDLQGAPHAHDLDAVGDRLDLSFEQLRLASVHQHQAQVLCRRRRGAHRSQLPHPLDDALAALGQVTLLAQLDPQHDGVAGECPIVRARVERYAGRIGAAPVQGVEHGEHNPAYRRCRVGLIEKTDDTAHGRCPPCPAR